MAIGDHNTGIRSGFIEPSRTAGASAPSVSSRDAAAKGDSDVSFMDFLKGVVDVINPLQHLPVIGTLYRKITGDEMAPAARLAGATLFGGPIGAALALADVASENATGKDIGETMMAAVSNDKEDTEQNFQTSPAPTTHRTGTSMAMNGNEPLASRSYKASTTPVSTREGATPVLASGAKDSRQGQNGSADATSQSQNAPAAGGRRPPAPELIASAEMKRGLDYYRANAIRPVHTPSVMRTG